MASYNSRPDIDASLDSLRRQDVDEPYEVILVDSGSDGCARYVQEAYPEVRIVRSERRLYPGAARNAGVRAAQGEYVAFLPTDCVADRRWLRRRLAKHREGFAAVGGAVTNGTPRHPIGSAGYYLEYTALLPSDRILAEQAVPHSLSFERAALERLGGYTEDLPTGEDTLVGRRCVETGMTIGFDEGAQIAHRNLTALGPYLRHQREHGRGYALVAHRYGWWAPIHPWDQPILAALLRIFVAYPIRRWGHALRRVARGRPRWLPGFIALAPIVLAGALSAAAGIWTELRSLRDQQRP
jgi:glycosyltransferase involved in cell wall biosynthesis